MNRNELGLLGSGFAAGILSIIIFQTLLGRPAFMASVPQVTAAPAPPQSAHLPPPPKAVMPVSNAAVRSAIKEILKDPDSAQFGRIFEGNRGARTICGEVNAKNGYGGYTGMTPFVYFPDTGKAMLITNPASLSMTKEGVEAYMRECKV